MSLETQLEQMLGKRPKYLIPLSGGMIGTVYRVDLADKSRFVAKVSNDTHATLDIEGYMLRYLREHSTLPVPEVLHSTNQLLLMTYIEGNSQLNARSQHHAAELLATLHNISAPNFGLPKDTLIGSLHQPNNQTSSWIKFFRDHRILHMATHAVKENHIGNNLYDRIQKFCANLEKWLEEPEYPSLIHGDMWTTNILTARDKITGFVDPAIYYADPEIELAFSTLFNTFGEPFFQRYAELRPIKAGFFEERRDIYNLYPLLVHVRLFGGGYANSIDAILRQFGY